MLSTRMRNAMMSDSCSKPTSLRCILRQIEYGVFSRPVTLAITPLASSVSRSSWITVSISAVPCSRRNERRVMIDCRASVCNSENARSSSSDLISCTADALGERRVDFHRLEGDAAALLRRLDEVQSAHVVGAVSELDQKDANVLAHRQHELAEVLGLLGLVRLKLNPGEAWSRRRRDAQRRRRTTP